MRKNILAFLLLIIVLVGVAEFTSGCGKTVNNQKDRQEKLVRSKKDEKIVEYKKSCKKLALWTVRHYRGVKSFDFFAYSDYGAGGRMINATINGKDSTVLNYSVSGYKNAKLLDFYFDFDGKVPLHKREDPKQNLDNIKIKYTWNGKQS